MTENHTPQGPIYGLDDPDQDRPETRFLMVILLDAIKQEQESIHFDPSRGDDNEFVVCYEKDGQLIEKKAAPIMVWRSVVLKLRSMAGLDSSDAASHFGNFSLRLSKNRVANFQILDDPSPDSKEKFSIVHKLRKATERPRKSLEELERDFSKLRQSKFLKGPD